MTNTWCKTCQLEHTSGHCPVVASTVEQIEGCQWHLERKFWEQIYCSVASNSSIGMSTKHSELAVSADAALDQWRKRWGKK